MQPSLSTKDLKKTLKTIIESSDTTVVFDTNAFKPPLEEEVTWLDFTKLEDRLLRTNTVDGYSIPELIVRSRLYNEVAARAMQKVQAKNTAYIQFLIRSFQLYDNLILPIQVKIELEYWIKGADIEGYEKWIKGEEKPFRSEAINTLVRIRNENPYFPSIFSVQFEYKKAVMYFIKNIPPEQIVDYRKDKRFLENIRKLAGIGKKKCSANDKQIFVSSFLSAEDRGGQNLVLISSDNGMVALAEYFDQNRMSSGMGIRVYTGCSCKLEQRTSTLIPQRFDLVYPSGRSQRIT